MSLRRTADGYMTISGFTQREFEGICRAIGRPELIQDPRLIDPAARRRNIDYLEEIIDAYTGVRTIAEVSAVMQAEGVPHGHVNTQVTLPSDAQVAHNRLLVEVEHPKAGRMRLPRGVVRFGGEAGAIRRPPPGLGEHSSEILAELGISAAEIARLRADEVVA